jgi:hypothetical protein
MVREREFPNRKFRLNQLHLNATDTLRGISHKLEVELRFGL